MNRTVIALSIAIVSLCGLFLFWFFPKKSAPPATKLVTQEHPNKMTMHAKTRIKTSFQHLRAEPLPVRNDPPALTSTNPDEMDIVSQLERQGIAREHALRIQTEQCVLSDKVFQHMSKASNWIAELQKAASSVILGKNGKPSMLRIYDIAGDSILRDFGIKDGDIIVLVDGEITTFSPSKAVEDTQKAYQLITDLQNGKPVSITVLRKGRPVHLVYRKW